MDLATVDKLLTTTRSVRKRLDLSRPVEPEIIERRIEIAIQAPTGSNLQGWHFVVVTDPVKKAGIAEQDPRFEQMPRIVDSANYLAEHLHEVPAHVIPCVEGRVETAAPLLQASLYGSIIPAAWSLMLALRARGIGAAWTTLHLMFERDVARLLEIPAEVTQAALLPVAYFTGADFGPAKRLAPRDRTHWNSWAHRRPA